MHCLLKIILLHLLTSASCNDTVAYNIDGNMMYELSKILSPEECHSFYANISGQEETEVITLEQISEGNNPIHSRKLRAITNPEQCQKTLRHWLDSKGDSVHWDHLAEALQAIGRSDVSLEHMGNNLRQDKNLESEKDVEEYNKIVQSQTFSLHLENKTPEQEQLRQDKKSTKIFSDLGNSEQLKQPKPESLPPYKINFNININVLLAMLIAFIWDMLILFLLNYFRRLF